MLAEIARRMRENSAGETPPIPWGEFASFDTEREFRRAIEDRAATLGLTVTWLVWSPSVFDMMERPGRGRGLSFSWEPLDSA